MAQMSETAVYNRCFAQLTNRPVPLKDPVYLQIKNKEIHALTACLDLLKQADFNSNGTFLNKGPFSKHILNTFYNFHRTWFPTSTVDQILGYRDEFDSNTQNTVEFSSPALSITYSLFNKSPIKNALSGSDDYYAFRGDESSDFTKETTIPVSGINGADPTVEVQRDTPFVTSPTGDLYGIKKRSLSFMLDNYSVGALTGNVLLNNSQFNLTLPANQFQHFGGGILGQQSYFLLNSGHPKGTIFDGSAKMPRKWAKTSLESLLCLSLPALRENDVQDLVDANSKTTFRNHASCMTCHATMDPFAATARNLVISETEPDMNTKIDKSIFVSSFSVKTDSTALFAPAAIPNYKNQMPKGQLYFRSYNTGELVSANVDTMEQLGQKLAETDEYYQCISKRYFQYFTGINVSLYDTRDKKNGDLNQSLTDRDKQDRKFVEYLGKELKSSQAINRIIELIIKSDYYSSPTFKMESK